MYGHGGHLGYVTRITMNFYSPNLKRLHMKFEWYQRRYLKLLRDGRPDTRAFGMPIAHVS